MINFSSLVISEEKEPVKKQVSISINKKIQLDVIPKKLTVSEAKALKDELHKIEPGYKKVLLDIDRFHNGVSIVMMFILT